MNQAEYTHQLIMQAMLMLRSLSQENSMESFNASLLRWVAKSLDSANAFLLSWPDENRQLLIQETAFDHTTPIRKNSVVNSFERFDEYLESTEDSSLVWGDTTGITELETLEIHSLIATKITITGEDDFEGKGVLLVCNRNKSAFPGHIYVSYDSLFCEIAKWVLHLHTSELYSSALRRYKDARARYKDAKSISSLTLVGSTASEILEFYARYSAQPPSYLIYDCVDAHIALFNGREIVADKLRLVLEECSKWLTTEPIGNSTDFDLIRYTLARGYFALGVEADEDWLAGKRFLYADKLEDL